MTFFKCHVCTDVACDASTHRFGIDRLHRFKSVCNCGEYTWALGADAKPERIQ